MNCEFPQLQLQKIASSPYTKLKINSDGTYSGFVDNEDIVISSAKIDAHNIMKGLSITSENVKTLMALLGSNTSFTEQDAACTWIKEHTDTWYVKHFVHD